MNDELKMAGRHTGLIKFIILNSSFIILLVSCSVQKQIARSAKENVLDAPALHTAHVGISIYEPETNRYWFDYQGDKYFVPASNIKIPTCYAAMKYLGDSLVGLKYGIAEENGWKERVVVIQPTGDPTFLHPDFTTQRSFEFLWQKFRIEKKKAGFLLLSPRFERWGSGWGWSDYEASYMVERSIFPIFGNIINVQLNSDEKRTYIDTFLMPGKRLKGQVLATQNSYLDKLINKMPSPLSIDNIIKGKVRIEREIASNDFRIKNDDNIFKSLSIPFVTEGASMALEILSDTLKKTFDNVLPAGDKNKYIWECEECDITSITINNWHEIRSQPTDSLLKPMMHRSDNFFAEQSLLMVSNEMFGFMNDSKIIDTLLKTDFKDLPQKPRWADGSGLSRYNLFTPQDFVVILNKMKNEFGMERIRVIFPTGGKGTISNYYKTESGYIYAKTGTLSGVVSLSGYLYTRKNKLLIFSILVNNHQSSATDVRRAVEKFIQQVRRKY